jgi:hypothetical protein
MLVPSTELFTSLTLRGGEIGGDLNAGSSAAIKSGIAVSRRTSCAEIQP